MKNTNNLGIIKKTATIFSFYLLFLVGFSTINYLVLLLIPVLILNLFINKSSFKEFKINIIDLGFILIVAYDFLNYLISANKYNSFISFFKIINLLFLYLEIRIFLSSKTNIKQVILFIALLGFLLSLATAFQFAIFNFNIHYEGFDDLNNFKHLYNPFGIYSNEWATVLLLTLPFSLSSYFILKEFSIYNNTKLVSVIAILFNIFGILASFSRGTYIALLSLFITTILTIIVFKILNTQTIFKYALILIIITIISIIPIKDSALTTINLFKTESQIRSFESRKNIWKSSFDMTGNNVLLGVGANNFGVQYAYNYDKSEDSVFTQRASNVILKLLVEKGVVGLIIRLVLV